GGGEARRGRRRRLLVRAVRRAALCLSVPGPRRPGGDAPRASPRPRKPLPPPEHLDRPPRRLGRELLGGERRGWTHRGAEGGGRRGVGSPGERGARLRLGGEGRENPPRGEAHSVVCRPARG